MKFRLVIPVFILALLGAATAGFASSKQAAEKASPIAGTAVQAAPAIVMPELKYEFTPVVDGAEVIHDFAVKNSGEGPLAIHQVKTG